MIFAEVNMRRCEHDICRSEDEKMRRREDVKMRE